MPLYFFDVDDGSEHSPDIEGVDLPNLRAAQVEATALAGEMLRDRQHEFWDVRSWTMTVTDEQGATLLVISVDGVAAPAVIHQLRQADGSFGAQGPNQAQAATVDAMKPPPSTRLGCAGS
jgi:hypothetical protein